MNRLVLIGNGFDLAHGLKTGYNDFILWYLKKHLSEAYDNKPFEDELIKVTRRNNHNFQGELSNVSDFVDHFYSNGLYKIVNKVYNVDGWLNDYQNPFEIRIKSSLLNTLLQNCSYTKWVEIENEFYDLLKSILRENTKERESNLSNLNESLAAIIRNLELYLSEIKVTHCNQEYASILESPILMEDIVSSDEILSSGLKYQEPNDTLILNFNYTSTVEEYFKVTPYSPRPRTFNVNYIHGKIDDKRNPLIFGFGDELDSDYNAMELEKLKGFFKFIKSFWYFKTSNYHNLLRFIESDDYQIFILGHSCGLSDRTMLNMLFEHENCKSIKIFYYDNGKTNNYDDLTLEISRHFKDKVKMRRIIVSKNNSVAMPQVAL